MRSVFIVALKNENKRKGSVMTELRERMSNDMILAGLKPRTRECYIDAVIGLSKYYNQSPATISEEELKEYFLHLIKDRKVAQTTLRQKICAVRFLFQNTLGKDFPVFDFIKPEKRHKLPNILSRKEVIRIIHGIKKPANAMIVRVLYSCGLRIGEAIALTTSDIDRERLMLKVCNGKGGRDRYLPLPVHILKQLEYYWCHDRPEIEGNLLFPSKFSHTGGPVNPTTVRRAFKLSLADCGITKSAKLHTLRHSYATHLMEAGVNMKMVQLLLGHKHLTTTMMYSHLTETSFIHLRDAIDSLVSDL
jgi:integrase/recombinase XerD